VFTGLIKGLGRVVAAQQNARGGFLKIRSGLGETLQLGDSVAVNGVCLTVVSRGDDWFGSDVMPVTMQATNLGRLHYGDQVNLEPAITLGEPLGGHIVSGHVDGVGRIRAIRTHSNAVLIQIAVSAAVGGLIRLKGSVAVNGVSLTVQSLLPGAFIISLIPHTFRETTFRRSQVGDLANLETERSVPAEQDAAPVVTQAGITEEFLREHGFA
jgi:riboflavin synthase